jgi:hypothetical protein
MDLGVVVLGAGPFLAEINVLAPTAVHKVFSLPDRAAGRTGFEQVSNDMTGNAAPSFENFVFLPDLVDLSLLDHRSLRFTRKWDEQLEGQVERIATVPNIKY